jgi:renalase
MAGLMAARTLDQNRIEYLIVDKRPSVGGRLTTMRLGPGLGDVGAQFFTVRTPEFQVLVDQWMEEDLVYQWSGGWSDGSLGAAAPAGHPRYAVRDGMHALAERLAQGLSVRTISPLVSVRAVGPGWLAQDRDGKGYTARALILTPPVPDSLRLLDAGKVQLAPDDREALERLSYAPCLAALLWVTGAVRLPEPGAIQQPGAPVSWISDNQRKGISADAAVITLHAGPELSRLLWDATDAEASAELQKALQPYLDSTSKIVESRICRWRHAVPTTLHPERYLTAAGLAPLVFAGDAFRWPRVEGAALSGIAAANALIRSLQ